MAATATYHVLPSETLDFSLPEDWPKWSRRFERFRKTSGLNLKEEEMQLNTLLYSMGDAADNMLCSFQISVDVKSYLHYHGGEIQAALRLMTRRIQTRTI